MTVYTRIVKAVLDSPGDFAPGVSGAVLDDEHTLVWCSDHPARGVQKDDTDLDGFVSEYETVEEHPNEAAVGGELSTPDDHPLADTSTFPDNAKFDGSKVPTEAVENGRVIWERF